MEELSTIQKGIANVAEGVQKGFQKLSDSLSCQLAYYSQVNLQQTSQLLDDAKIQEVSFGVHPREGVARQRSRGAGWGRCAEHSMRVVGRLPPPTTL